MSIHFSDWVQSGNDFKNRLGVRGVHFLLLLGAILVPAGLFAGPLVINNGDSGTDEVGGSWTKSTNTSEMPNSGSALYRSVDGGYYFYPKLSAGSYRISMWWTTRDNLQDSVPVTVMTKTGKSQTKVNQDQNGGRWNLLGTYDLDSSTAYVKIFAVGTRETCADAVMFESAADSTSTSTSDSTSTSTAASTSTSTSDSAPLAPRGISATAASPAINVNWYDNTETDLASYAVYRSTTSGSGFALLAHGLTRSYYSDGTARAGTPYYYCVTAVDTAGNVSPLSAQAWATIPGTNLAPAVPGGLVATAATNSISLNWNDNSESDLAGYLVYRSTTSGTGFAPLAENLTQSSYADTSIQAGTTYYYIVFAFDTSGNTSPASAQVTATVPAAAAGFFETIAWSAPTANTDGSTLKDLAGYKVYVGTSSRKYTSVQSAGKVTQYTVGPLPAGTYYFCVTSCDSSGNESSFSTEVSTSVQ